MKETSTRRKAAVTADVVGQRPRKQRVPAKWKSHYEHLVELRQYLVSHQDDLVKDAKEEQPAFSLHMADAGTDSYDRDLALSQASAEQDAVYEIDQALDRMRKGSYGLCELTGKPIEPARLEAIPWTRFSLEAETDLEKKGIVRRAGLAPRASVSRSSGTEPNADEESAEEE